MDFNPRTPRGVRLHIDHIMSEVGEISIHAPREGCDQMHDCYDTTYQIFQSTHPARGATADEPTSMLDPSGKFQSTHPARGATNWSEDTRPLWGDFNPRTPRGVRLFCCQPLIGFAGISIHAPREGCDAVLLFPQLIDAISIHAPREGCDLPILTQEASHDKISIHAPREGCDS